ncbi:MAG: hypothetical protein AB1899_18470 [Pseudomonadota bacterium]
MDNDKWLVDLVQQMRRAKTRAQLEEVLDRLEDHYDAFSGPGQETLDELLEEGRRRLASL